jgi:uncharacterized protein YjbJ (UPF0337 family)
MNNDELQAKWDRLTAKAKRQWGKLTNDEIEQAKGNRDELIAKIQEKYGESKDTIAKKFNDWWDDKN